MNEPKITDRSYPVAIGDFPNARETDILIPKGNKLWFAVRPENIFRASSLRVAHGAAPKLLIVNLRVGTYEQLASPGNAIPAVAMNSPGSYIAFSTCNIGQQLQIQFQATEDVYRKDCVCMIEEDGKLRLQDDTIACFVGKEVAP